MIENNSSEVLKLSANQIDPADHSVGTYVQVWDNWVFQKVGRKILAEYPDSVTETYTFRQGATTLYVLTVVYTDSTKVTLTSVERTA